MEGGEFEQVEEEQEIDKERTRAAQVLIEGLQDDAARRIARAAIEPLLDDVDIQEHDGSPDATVSEGRSAVGIADRNPYYKVETNDLDNDVSNRPSQPHFELDDKADPLLERPNEEAVVDSSGDATNPSLEGLRHGWDLMTLASLLLAFQSISDIIRAHPPPLGARQPRDYVVWVLNLIGHVLDHVRRTYPREFRHFDDRYMGWREGRDDVGGGGDRGQR